MFIYEQINGRFEQVQHLIGPKGLPNEKFGTVIRYDNDRIVVHSAGGDLFNRTEFDSGTTVFDNGTTFFSSTLVDTGEVFVFELRHCGCRFGLCFALGGAICYRSTATASCTTLRATLPQPPSFSA